MNQKIQQLADQAKKSVPQGLGVDKWIEAYNEKLAELIVRECAEVARLNTRVDSKVYLMIQEHFGVTE